MFNPEMISQLIRLKIDEILNGTYPEGLTLVERTENKIIFSLNNVEKYQGITLNRLNVSLSYNGVEIIINHGS